MEFNAEKMRKFVEKDGFLKFQFTDMMKRRTPIEEEDVLQVLFNSNVLEDSVMEDEYNRL